MKKMKIIAIIVALAATAMIALTACGDKDKIVGTWTSVDDRYMHITFYSDGTLRMAGVDGGEWEISNGKFKMVSPIFDIKGESDYKLDGDTLTFNGRTYYRDSE